MQGVKGENFENRSQKVFCELLGQLSVRHVHGRARPMKICQNGHGHRYHGHHHGLGHDHRCHAMLVFISPTAEGHVAHLAAQGRSFGWTFFLYEKLPFLHFRPLFVCSQFARTHMWVSQRERKELNLKRLKKKSWCDEKEGPLNVYSREDKHKIGILHFAGISQERWEGSIVETNDYKSSTRHTNLFGFFSCFQTCPNGFAISFGLSPSTSMV